jgi:N-methylhydantoinase B
MNGGYGAGAGHDGANVLSWPSNVSAAPVEMIEQANPFRIAHRRLRQGTGGAGRHRGGTGQEWAFRSLSETPVAITFMAERTRAEAAAPGLEGGCAGTPGAVLIDGQVVDPKRQHILRPGSTVELRTPGGGGYGRPEKRPAELVEQDHEDGLVAGTLA